MPLSAILLRRVLNPNASEAGYKPDRRRGGNTPWENIPWWNVPGGIFRGGAYLEPHILPGTDFSDTALWCRDGNIWFVTILISTDYLLLRYSNSIALYSNSIALRDIGIRPQPIFMSKNLKELENSPVPHSTPSILDPHIEDMMGLKRLSRGGLVCLSICL